MKKSCAVCVTADLLLVVGGLNWGLVGLGGFLNSNLNLVNLLLGGFPVIENIVYILVGIAGIKLLLKVVLHKDCSCQGECGDDDKSQMKEGGAMERGNEMEGENEEEKEG